jgi:hypothetical protein
MLQQLQALQKSHAVVIYDVKAAVDSSQHFAPNLNAYCVTTGVTDVGAAGIPLIKEGSAAELQKAGATHVTQKDVEIGGVPGVATSYQFHSPTTGVVIDGTQLEVLPKPEKACFVTVTTNPGLAASTIVSVAAATAQFP